jgi:Protein of unknown function (DUF3990)
MPWSNGPLVVYHGTDSLSANNIRLNGIQPRYFVAKTDFGAGFYVTTSLHQAKNWANEKVRTQGSGAYSAEVLEYNLQRSSITNLEHLTFVTDTQDYYDLVDYCWNAQINHGATRSKPYDVIYGPVSLHPQVLVIANCDQIYFCDPASISGFQSPANVIRSAPNRFF